MIKVSELRIGNYISDDDGVLAKVTGFAPCEHSVRCDEEEGCKLLVDCYHANGSRRSGCETDSPECDPIPLTVEWMARLGFAWNPDDKRYFIQIGNQLYIELDTDFDCYIAGESRAGSSPWNKTKHVHQLQNLYHALTGEELIITL